MKIYKLSQHEEINLPYEGIDLPASFQRDAIGSCMLAAEILTKELKSKGIENFKVIEGYITFPNVEWEDQHTWIEMNNGKTLDPTKGQWGLKNIIYLTNKRKIYSPDKYLSLCEQHPVENPNKFL